MKIGDLVRPREHPQYCGVVIRTMQDDGEYAYCVHWFDDNDWTWEMCRDLEVICEGRRFNFG